MSRIVRNSLLNGIALGITSVLSLVLVPVLIGTYGLEAYGLLPLLRLLSPLGALGIATFGLPQLAMRSAAIYSTRGEHETLERSQSTLVALGVLLGAIAAAVLLGIGWERFAGWFKVAPTERAAFSIGFDITALLMPLVMPGFLLTAALSGIGHFRILRMTDVVAYLLYFVASVAAVWAALPVVYVVIALLSADALRATALFVHARRAALIKFALVLRPDIGWMRSQGREFMVLSTAGIMGYTRKHLAGATMPILFGTGALGLYDAIERVPRALNSLLGLVNSTVLPHAIRLDVAADTVKLHSLLVRGTRLTLLATVPFAAACMLYAAPIVEIWLGSHLTYGALYLVLLMIPFLLDSTLSIITTATLSRLDLISQQNRVALVEIVVFCVVLGVLVPLWGEPAPYVATALAAVVGYGMRTKVFLPAYGISGSSWLKLLMKVIAASAAGAGCVFLAVRMAGAPPTLLLLTAPLAVLAAMGAVVLLWDAEERRDLHSVFDSLRGMITRRASR